MNEHLNLRAKKLQSSFYSNSNKLSMKWPEDEKDKLFGLSPSWSIRALQYNKTTITKIMKAQCKEWYPICKQTLTSHWYLFLLYYDRIATSEHTFARDKFQQKGRSMKWPEDDEHKRRIADHHLAQLPHLVSLSDSYQTNKTTGFLIRQMKTVPTRHLPDTCTPHQTNQNGIRQSSDNELVGIRQSD